MFAAKNELFTRPSGGYQISRSLRFNSADSAYLNRSPTTSGSSTIWTYSAWFKLSLLGTNVTLLSAANPTESSSDIDTIDLNADKIRIFFQGATSGYLQTTQVFRDPSAWYHIVVAVDTTQATSSNRIKLYINGSQVTTFSTSTYPSQNYATYFNISGRRTTIGGTARTTTSGFFDGYQTEVNWIDGTQLTPSSFGSTNADTGVWQPKAFSGGAYGTNGFYLNFSDNSNTTAATLGKDYSGNGNNWTPNNFSVTAGVGNDSLVDSPTSYGTDTGVGGEVRGNYATLNAVDTATTSTLSNGNLNISLSGASGSSQASTIAMTSGKWYWEVTESAVANQAGQIGIMRGNIAPATITYTSNPSGVYYAAATGNKNLDGTQTAYGTAWGSTGTTYVIGIALDADAGTVTFYLNNTSQGLITLPSNTNGWRAQSLWSSGSGTGTLDFNFGQRPFAYTAPSGFKALCTQNLPTPTIGATTATQAGKYFNPVIYTGTGASLSVTGVGFQPDWVWVKGRSGATDHGLYDAVRGVQKQIESNNTDAETTETTGLTAFGSDGFTTGALAQLNTSAATYVAWNWRASNATAVTNTSGTITSTVSANTTSGFSIVTYTGTGVTASVGHGLGALPQMIIVKRRNSTGDWAVYHRTLGANTYLVLNSTAASAAISGYWQYTPSPGNPTVDWFGIIAGYDVNLSSATYVAYCFAEVAGYSKFGSYTGNGSNDGPFVFTNFKPAYVMLKSTGVEQWLIFDTARGTYNNNNPYLVASSSGAEGAFTAPQMLSNGFRLNTNDLGLNQNTVTYIYMAFASVPFKYSLAR